MKDAVEFLSKMRYYTLGIFIQGSDNVDFKELRERSGMSMVEFGEFFNIPYRTIQNWEYGQRKCPEYLIELMAYKLEVEKQGKIFVIYRDSWGDLPEMVGYIVGNPEDAYECCKEINKDCKDFRKAVDFEEVKYLQIDKK